MRRQIAHARAIDELPHSPVGDGNEDHGKPCYEIFAQHAGPSNMTGLEEKEEIRAIAACPVPDFTGTPSQ
ncbi:hypothetical protein JCM12178A_11110 [Salidesulfovibrio brasiliensis]